MWRAIYFDSRAFVHRGGLGKSFEAGREPADCVAPLSAATNAFDESLGQLRLKHPPGAPQETAKHVNPERKREICKYCGQFHHFIRLIRKRLSVADAAFNS
jgi:hypothetical protein